MEARESRIHVLPELLVKKIAAGEVVERPASVVKELLENAVDAAATRIAVTIEDGGRQLVRVTDDGCGMTPEELRLSVTPHATSKLRVEEDLYAIATMGFRGEALASISSVSRLRIVSRPGDAVEGYELCVVADHVEAARAAGSPVGTTIEVRDLFFNVPARRKFLRSNSTEVGHVNEQFARVALANPRIGFELRNNGRLSQNLPGCASRLDRVSKFYGPELAAALLPIERAERGIEMEAYVAPPSQSRATAQWQYTFVNGRYIRDRFVQHAIKEAYRGLTEPNRHGVVFLFLTIDPGEVDVNVHPTKNEVRWAEPSLIRSQVLSALRETFRGRDLVPAMRADRAREPVNEAEQDRIRHDMADVLKATTPIRAGSAGDTGPRLSYGGLPPMGSPGGRGGDPMRAWQSLYNTPPTPVAEPNSAEGGVRPVYAPPDDRANRGTEETHALPRPRAVQMHNLYLVAETEEGIVIVDQHALHERIMYEHLKARMTKGPLESQRLLLPETMTVTAQQIALLEDHTRLLGQIGLEVSAFGADSVAVQSFPSLLRDTDVLAFLRDLLDYLGQQAGETTPDIVIDHILSMMACKAAVKAGDPLTPVEIEALFAQREMIEKSTSCPHGRPTMLRFTKADLERQFHRT